MKDPRVKKLADVLVTYSCEVKPGEKVLIETTDIADDVVTVLIDRVAEAGGIPFVTNKRTTVTRALLNNATERQMKLAGEFEAARMKEMDAYIAIRGTLNLTEMSDVPGDKLRLFEKLWRHPVHTEIRVKKTKWVVLRWPTPSMAQQAGMSTEAFENFYFDVCTFDYSKLALIDQALKQRMDQTDRVRLVSPGTDLTFSIKDIPTIPCTGKRNIPDGEMFTAPVRDSVNGTIVFNTPTISQGTVFENISLTFKDGKIIEATSHGDTSAKLNHILDTDDGARYIGEFSLGYNPYITQPMKDILFDEKIAGSFHFTPGQAYEEAYNGNDSSVHWDMVLIQRPEFGGGEIWFDDVLIRKDGLFVTPDLEALNPEELRASL